jgi:hypothetical protein
MERNDQSTEDQPARESERPHSERDVRDAPDEPRRPDEDAPGNFVDDREAPAVPEPNEPG